MQYALPEDYSGEAGTDLLSAWAFIQEFRDCLGIGKFRCVLVLSASFLIVVSLCACVVEISLAPSSMCL